jgi:hypothetical protein
VTIRDMALVSAGRPPSSGIFSRCTMTTKLCGVVSALRQSQLTVQPTGTTILAAPFRYSLMSAELAPDRADVASVRVTVLPAESTASQSGELAGAESGAGAEGEAAGAAGVAAAAAGLSVRPAQALSESSKAVAILIG